MDKIKGQELMESICEMKYDENIARNLFKQILEGIAYMHEHGVCHRDIKPSNILVLDDKSSIVITDFNISKYFANKAFKMLTYTGTEAFKAPEMLEAAFYNEKIDLWAAGCVLFTMLAGSMPFFDENLPRLHRAIKNAEYDMKSEPWPSISESAKDLIRKLICID